MLHTEGCLTDILIIMYVSGIPQVSQKIEELTEALLMSESNHFSSESIIIEILSPDVPELTLIDLPGFFLDAVNDQVTSSCKYGVYDAA